MPSKSKAQHNLMAMVAHDRKAAKRLGIPQSVGREFMKADKGKVKKMRSGGMPLPGDRSTGFGKGTHNLNQAAVNRGFTGLKTAASFLPGIVGKAAKIGSVLPMIAEAAAAPPPPPPSDQAKRAGGTIKSKKSRYAAGGSVSSASKRADGIATKGKTRGKFV